MVRLTLIASLVLTRLVAAQAGTFVQTGRLVDASSEGPIRRGQVCYAPVPSSGAPSLWQCLPVDTGGRFHLDTLIPKSLILIFSCATSRFFGKELGRRVLDSSMVLASAPVFSFDATGCDQRPFDVTRTVFFGHYSYGFEEGRFTSCVDSGRIAWVEFTHEPNGAAWPAPTTTGGSSEVFVRWHGTMIGPGSYGHLGIAAYLLQVDSVIEVRKPSRADCR